LLNTYIVRPLPTSTTAALDTRGSAYIEYLVLVGAVGIVGAAAIAWLGLPLLRLFRYAQLILSAPVP